MHMPPNLNFSFMLHVQVDISWTIFHTDNWQIVHVSEICHRLCLHCCFVIETNKSFFKWIACWDPHQQSHPYTLHVSKIIRQLRTTLKIQCDLHCFWPTRKQSQSSITRILLRWNRPVAWTLIRPCKTCMSIDNIYPNKIIEPIHTSQMCVIVIQGCFYIVCIWLILQVFLL